MLLIPPTNYHLLAAKLEPYQKAYLLMKNTEEFSGEKKLQARRARREQDRQSNGSKQ